MFFLIKNKLTVIIFIFVSIFFTVSCENQSIRNKNETCQNGEESEFPEDLFTKTQRQFGAIILHVILFLYCFGAIALICSEYFLPSIQCICEDLKLSDDVAAATFMSIATSSPELFTNIIGTFIVESDIGIGHVIGNAYFNMFFVAALGGLVASQEIILDWWPLARDCSIYFIVAITLTGIVWDGYIKTYETIILLLLYVVYFLIMFNNQKVKRIISKKFNVGISDTGGNHVELNLKANDTTKKTSQNEKSEEAEPLDCEQTFTLPAPPTQTPPKVQNKYWKLFKKVVTLPLKMVIRYTIPDVRKLSLRKYYPIAFVLCIAWIGISTYLGTWMVYVIGDTAGIPDLIMGMVFMAAAGSVVEAYAVCYSAKRGKCSIGLSNSIGCNNLDATLSLALPWFIKTLMPNESSKCANGSSNISLGSSLLHINCGLLVISVLVLFCIFYVNKFRLNKKLGFICGSLYVLILIIAISIESNGTSR